MRARALLVVGLAAGLLSACGSDDEPASNAEPTDTGESSPSDSASPSPTETGPLLPSSCGTVLPLPEIDEVLGRRIVGDTQYIRGQAQPDIGRVERVNCRYGVTQQGVIPIEIGLSRYETAEQATDRVQFTVQQERSNGAAPTAVPLGDLEATVLTAPKSTLLVLADDDLTVALTVDASLATGERAVAQASALAGKVLENLAETPVGEDDGN